MNLSLKNRSQIEGLRRNFVADEFDAMNASIQTSYGRQHNSDDSHGDVTADSITVNGLTQLLGNVAVGTAATNVTFTVRGFGSHIFSAAGVGSNGLIVQNAVAGVGNFAWFEARADEANGVQLSQTSSTYNTAVVLPTDPPNIASAGHLVSSRTGGLNLVGTNGPLRFYANTQATVRGQMHSSGGFSWGDTTDPGNTNMRIAGTLTVVGAVTLTVPLPTGSGGTGLSTYTAGDIPYYSAGTAFSKLAVGASAGMFVRSTGTLPGWSTLILPNAITANRVVYGSATDTYGSSANFTFDGTVFSVLSFGAHSFASSGTGANSLLVSNTAAGAANFGWVEARADETSGVRLVSTSTTYNTAASAAIDPANIASAGNVVAGRGGGLNLIGANGPVRMYSANASTVRLSVQTGVRIGSTVTDPGTGNLYVEGDAKYGTTSNFTYNTKSVNTVYQAASDGFVVCTFTCTIVAAALSSVQGLSDSANPPTVVVSQWSSSITGATSNQIMFPVKKSDYYKVVSNQGIGDTLTISNIWWVPNGFNG